MLSQPQPHRRTRLQDEREGTAARLHRPQDGRIGGLQELAPRCLPGDERGATQRPSGNVVTGLIKANFPTRIAFRVQSGVDSRTILDQTGAETLLGKGDLLYQSAGKIQRLHAALLEDSEVRKLVKACA